MDIRSGKGYPASALSNFSPHPFTFQGVEIASMEGFLQSLKYENPHMQIEVCKLVGFKAKRFGAKKNWQRDQTLYWQETSMGRESDEYQELLDAVYNAMFDGNEKARKALLATMSANISHSIGRTKKRETVLTRQEFCSRLMNIRKRLQTEQATKDLFD